MLNGQQINEATSLVRMPRRMTDGHGHVSFIGLFLKGGLFLIGKADPEHVGTEFLAHVFSIVPVVAYWKTRLPGITTQPDALVRRYAP